MQWHGWAALLKLPRSATRTNTVSCGLNMDSLLAVKTFGLYYGTKPELPCQGRGEYNKRKSAAYTAGQQEGPNMDWNELKNTSLFPVGEPNDAYAQYFDGQS